MKLLKIMVAILSLTALAACSSGVGNNEETDGSIPIYGEISIDSMDSIVSTAIKDAWGEGSGEAEGTVQRGSDSVVVDIKFPTYVFRDNIVMTGFALDSRWKATIDSLGSDDSYIEIRDGNFYAGGNHEGFCEDFNVVDGACDATELAADMLAQTCQDPGINEANCIVVTAYSDNFEVSNKITVAGRALNTEISDSQYIPVLTTVRYTYLTDATDAGGAIRMMMWPAYEVGFWPEAILNPGLIEDMDLDYAAVGVYPNGMTWASTIFPYLGSDALNTCDNAEDDTPGSVTAFDYALDTITFAGAGWQVDEFAGEQVDLTTVNGIFTLDIVSNTADTLSVEQDLDAATHGIQAADAFNILTGDGEFGVALAQTGGGAAVVPADLADQFVDFYSMQQYSDTSTCAQDCASSLKDANASWQVDEFAQDVNGPLFQVQLMDDNGVLGEALNILSNTATELTLDGSWVVEPDESTEYVISNIEPGVVKGDDNLVADSFNIIGNITSIGADKYETTNARCMIGDNVVLGISLQGLYQVSGAKAGAGAGISAQRGFRVAGALCADAARCNWDFADFGDIVLPAIP